MNKLILTLLVVLALLLVSCGATEDSQVVATEEPQPTATEEPQPTATEEPQPTATEEPQPTATEEPPASANLNPSGFANLGDLVEGGGYSLAVIRVEDPTTPSSSYTPKAETKLIAVELVVGNVSGEVMQSNRLYATLVDSNGFLYEPELSGRDDELILKDLQMGNRLKGWISFEIPENSIPTGIRYEFVGYPKIALQTGLFTADGQRTANSNFPLTTSGNVQRSIDGKLGDTIQRDGYLLSVIAVEDPTTQSSSYTPKAGTKLIAVELVVGNVSGEAMLTNRLNAALVDSNDFLYEPELSGRDGELDLLDLTAGNRVKGWISFEIPENAIPDRIRYKFTSYPSVTIYSSLR